MADEKIYSMIWAFGVFAFTMVAIMNMPSFISENTPLSTFVIAFLFIVTVIGFLNLFR